MKEKKDIAELAQRFIYLNPDEFAKFWLLVCFEWNIEESDLEMQWFMNGKTAPHSVLSVISAMHSAVASGKKSGDGK